MLCLVACHFFLGRLFWDAPNGCSEWSWHRCSKRCCSVLADIDALLALSCSVLSCSACRALIADSDALSWNRRLLQCSSRTPCKYHGMGLDFYCVVQLSGRGWHRTPMNCTLPFHSLVMLMPRICAQIVNGGGIQNDALHFQLSLDFCFFAGLSKHCWCALGWYCWWSFQRGLIASEDRHRLWDSLWCQRSCCRWSLSRPHLSKWGYDDNVLENHRPWI